MANIIDWFRDTVTGGANNLGNYGAPKAIASKPGYTPSFSTSKKNPGLGLTSVGGKQRADAAAYRAKAPAISFSGGGGVGGSFGSSPEEQYPAFGKTLADYLAEAQGYTSQGISGQLADLAAKRAALQQQAGTGDQRLASLYQALNTLIQSGNADLARSYTDAQAASKATTAEAIANMAAANQNIASLQGDFAKNLGTAGGLDPTQVDYAQIANSGVQSTGNAALQQLIANSLSQQKQGNAYQMAGQIQGTQSRADLQQALLNALADIAANETSVRSSASGNALGMAQNMYNSDYGAWQDQRNFEANRGDEAWNRAYQQQQLSGQGQSDPLTGRLAISEQLNNAFDPSTSNYIQDLVTQSLAGATGSNQGTSLYTLFLNALQQDRTLTPEQKRAASVIVQPGLSQIK